MFKEITVSRQQAVYLAQKLSAFQVAEKEFKETLWVLALGHDVNTDALLDINTETNTLTFAAVPDTGQDQLANV
jgi:hypothetical protein